jgi:Fe-S-cluster containining protein
MARNEEEDHLETRLPEGLHASVAQGFLHTHTRANANTAKLLEATSFLYALVEILEEKGLISIEELDARKEVVAKRLGERFAKDGMGAIFANPEREKYGFEGAKGIDCENRVHLCKAACCRLPFALSRQDVEEGVVRWNLGQPYLIDQREDGYCAHLDRGCLGCTIYEHRPVPCRGFDCRHDKRIWLDFDQKIPNPAVARADWLEMVSREEDTVSEGEEDS